MIRAVCTVSGCGAAAVDLVTGAGPVPVARAGCDEHRNMIAGELVAGGAGAYAVRLEVCTVMHAEPVRAGWRVILAAEVIRPGAAMLTVTVPGTPEWVGVWLEETRGHEPAPVVAGTCDRCRLPGPMYVTDYAGPAGPGADPYGPARVCHRVH